MNALRKFYQQHAVLADNMLKAEKRLAEMSWEERRGIQSLIDAGHADLFHLDPNGDFKSWSSRYGELMSQLGYFVMPSTENTVTCKLDLVTVKNIVIAVQMSKVTSNLWDL